MDKEKGDDSDEALVQSENDQEEVVNVVLSFKIVSKAVDLQRC